MTQETNFDQLDCEMQDRLEWAQFNAQRENETRNQFLLRVASMLLRGSDQSMWAGGEHFGTWDVADELERMRFEMEE
jgi:hypothetical protein